MVKFEWDERKRLANLEKHGVDFADALLIFENHHIYALDNRFDYREQRFKAIGCVDDDCFVVIYTERDETLRIVSAWKGGRHDRRTYQASLLS